MQNVLRKIGLYLLVVLDDGIPFKGSFVEKWDAFYLRYGVAAKRNHKVVSVERCHRFLNKAHTMASNDRDTVGMFVEAGITIAYAWNSTKIDGTDIIRSISNVEGELKSTFDIEL